MKKIVVTLVVILMTIGANAQVYVGGSLGFGSGKGSTKDFESDIKSTTFKILPEIGYELNENWSIGTVIGYEYSKLDDSKINTFTVAPYARYSFFKSDLVRLFVDGGFGFSTAKIKDNDDALNSWNVGLKPGLAIKLSDNFCLVAKYGFLGYDCSKYGEVKAHNFGLNFDTDELNFGFHYIF